MNQDVLLASDWDDATPGFWRGAVRVYRHDGEQWLASRPLRHEGLLNSHFFAASLALSGETAIVGAIAHSNGEQGAAVIYHVHDGTLETVTERRPPYPEDLGGRTFGSYVAIDENQAMIADPEREVCNDPPMLYGIVMMLDDISTRDCDANGVMDGCDIAVDPAADGDHDGRLDRCNRGGGDGGRCVTDLLPVGAPDGTTDIDDLMFIVNSWGACSGCAADIVPRGGNGVVNIDDLYAVIAAWGPCP